MVFISFNSINVLQTCTSNTRYQMHLFNVLCHFEVFYTIPVILNHFSWKSNPCSQQADSFRITCKTRLIFSAFYTLIIFHSFSAVCGRLKKWNFLIASWIDFMVLYVPDNENACQKCPKICRYWPLSYILSFIIYCDSCWVFRNFLSLLQLQGYEVSGSQVWSGWWTVHMTYITHDPWSVF